MLRILLRLTISASSGAALAVLLIGLVTYFFPDPTGTTRQTGQPAQLAQVLMRTTPQEVPVDRPTQAPTDTQEVSTQTKPPKADIRSSPSSEDIVGQSAERDRGVRSNAQASEQQRQVESGLIPETSPENALAPPVAIDNRNGFDRTLPLLVPAAISEQNGLAGTARTNRPVLSQNDNSTVAVSAADDSTKIELAGQAPSSVSLPQDRHAAAESSAHGPGEQQQSTENSNTSKLSVAEHITIHYRRDSGPARADAQQLASWLASSGFGTPRLLTTKRGVASPVVRYFFKEDAETVVLLVHALQVENRSWRVEDCRSYRHKPPTGTIEVWPHV